MKIYIWQKWQSSKRIFEFDESAPARFDWSWWKNSVNATDFAPKADHLWSPHLCTLLFIKRDSWNSRTNDRNLLVAKILALWEREQIVLLDQYQHLNDETVPSILWMPPKHKREHELEEVTKLKWPKGSVWSWIHFEPHLEHIKHPYSTEKRASSVYVTCKLKSKKRNFSQ